MSYRLRLLAAGIDVLGTATGKRVFRGVRDPESVPGTEGDYYCVNVGADPVIPTKSERTRLYRSVDLIVWGFCRVDRTLTPDVDTESVREAHYKLAYDVLMSTSVAPGSFQKRLDDDLIANNQNGVIQVLSAFVEPVEMLPPYGIFRAVFQCSATHLFGTL